MSIVFEHNNTKYIYHVFNRDFYNMDIYPYSSNDVDVSINPSFFMKQARGMYPDKQMYLENL